MDNNSNLDKHALMLMVIVKYLKHIPGFNEFVAKEFMKNEYKNMEDLQEELKKVFFENAIEFNENENNENVSGGAKKSKAKPKQKKKTPAKK